MDEKLKSIVEKCINDFNCKKVLYEKVHDYCVSGESDARKKYINNPKRSNLKVKTNFIKKFLKEEVSYLLSNKPTYTSKSDNSEVISFIEHKQAHWKDGHDKELLRDLLAYGITYELYYIEKKGEESLFTAKVVSPLEGYALEDENGDISLFIRFYKKKFDETQYIDIYTKDFIYHYNSSYEEIKVPTVNVFREVPVRAVTVSKYREYDTLFNDIKDLQDAFETNLSDIVNEISDYRLAYLLALGVSLDTDQIAEMKAKGIINSEQKDAVIKFLTKDINDTFVQNTLRTLEKQIYNISSHIDTNEKLQSNTSGEALRNRLIGLEQRVRDSESSMRDIIKDRFYFMFKLFKILEGVNYDYRDIKIEFTLNIPKNDLTTAQMLSQLPEGVISKVTSRSLFSFVNNPDSEDKKVKKENEEEMKKFKIDVGNPHEE